MTLCKEQQEVSNRVEPLSICDTSEGPCMTLHNYKPFFSYKGNCYPDIYGNDPLIFIYILAFNYTTINTIDTIV